MIEQVKDLTAFENYYEFYKKTCKEKMNESLDDFIEYCKKGVVLKNDCYQALFIPADNFVFVFYLLKINGKIVNYRKKMKDFFEKAFKKFGKMLVGFRGEKEICIFGKFGNRWILIFYNLKKNLMYVKQI